MAQWQGFSAQLQTPQDLLRKLGRDLGRLRRTPDDAFAAFDFFVAAEHMVDWCYPDDRARQRQVRLREPLRTVSHLASGAKHFRASASHHASVSELQSEADHGTAVLGRARLGEMRLGSRGSPALVITTTAGRRYTALQLAELVHEYWQVELGPGGIHEHASGRRPASVAPSDRRTQS